MFTALCLFLLVAATLMACHDGSDKRHRAIWETMAALLLVAGLALIGYGIKHSF